MSGTIATLTSARQVTTVPVYGLAGASAQYAIGKIAKTLTSRGIRSVFVWHAAKLLG